LTGTERRPVRILAIADQVEERLYGRLQEIAPDLVLAAGDLPFEYLENIVSTLNVPLLFVPGNHDADLRATDPVLTPAGLEMPETTGPLGCVNVDGRLEAAAGLWIAGLGGSIRYRAGPNQYSQGEMRRRALALELRARLRRRRVDILLTHSPPLGVGDEKDAAHQGFAAFHGLVKRLKPRLLIHGHVHPYGRTLPDRQLGETLVVNAVGYRVLEL
jgi:Icc-related predicted phosphoesterase